MQKYNENFSNIDIYGKIKISKLNLEDFIFRFCSLNRNELLIILKSCHISYSVLM